MKLPGLQFVTEHKRFYPQASIGAHVIGFTGLDPKGLEGVELAYDQMLQGEPGRLLSQHDARGRGMATADQLVQGGDPGYNLQLTLDRSLQYIAEKELAKVVKERKAVGGTVVVMEPASGKILASPITTRIRLETFVPVHGVTGPFAICTSRDQRLSRSCWPESWKKVWSVSTRRPIAKMVATRSVAKLSATTKVTGN